MAEITKPIALDETVQQLVGACRDIADAVTNSKAGVVYGFHIKSNESNPASMVTYLRDAIGATPAHMDYTNNRFDYGSWEDVFFMPRPCMVKSDGTVDYYLDPNDYTKKADGTASDVANTSYDGNAMMEWGRDGKKIWMKIVPDLDHLGASVYIADYRVDSTYHDYPFHNSKGVSVDHFYTAIYNGSVINSKMRSLSGQQVSKILTADAEITAAKANNAGSDILWNTELHSDILLINMLLVLMGKSVDVQSVFGEGVYTGGSEAVNDTFRTGQHNAKGLFYGTNSGQCASNSFGNIVKVFGMENWWGFQWRRYQGHLLVDGKHLVKNTYGTEDGSTANGYNLTGSGFKQKNATTSSGTSGNYIKNEWFDEDGMYPCGALEGSSSTYYCDGYWYNNSGVRVPIRGGDSGAGARVGSFCVLLHATSSGADWNFGAALSCKPLA